MSAEKPKIDDLLKRIDELIEIFRILSSDLKEISDDLRSITGARITPPSPEAGEAIKQFRTINDVQRVFPHDLVGMLYFEETGEHILIRPRQYLGSDNFARIASIIRDQLGGEYISAGKDSHFRVPRKI